MRCSPSLTCTAWISMNRPTSRRSPQTRDGHEPAAEARELFGGCFPGGDQADQLVLHPGPAFGQKLDQSGLETQKAPQEQGFLE